MKIKVFAIFLLAICIFGFRSSVMVYADNSFQICLIGQGCYYATPDSAEICGTIEFFDKDKSNAESLAKEYFEDLKLCLKKIDVDLIKNYFCTLENYARCENSLDIYVSRIDFKADINNLNNLDELLNYLDVDNIVLNYIRYYLYDSSNAYNNALLDAIADANTKLKKLNILQSAKIIEIEEKETYCSFDTYVYDFENLEITPIKISAQIEVLYG